MRKISIILLLLLIAGHVYILQYRPLEEIGAGAAPVATPVAPVINVKTENKVVANGVVVPNQFTNLSMASSGIVQKMLVREGDHVTAGQLLIQLDSTQQVIDLARAQATLEGAQARLAELEAGARPQEIAASQATLEEAKANLARLREGPRTENVAALQAEINAAQAALQDLIDGPNNDNIINAKAELANAGAVLQQKQSAYNQVKWRNDIGALPESAELQQATNNFEAAQARYDVLVAPANNALVADARARIQKARAELDRANTTATVSEIEAADAVVRRAQAQLELLKAGTRPEIVAAAVAEVASAQASFFQAQAALEKTKLVAPFTGLIAELSIHIGEQVSTGIPVVQLADDSIWQVNTDDLVELNVVNILEGDTAEIRVDAIPNLTLMGIVTHVKPLGENKQGDITYKVVINLEEQDPRLRWNMTTEVTIKPSRTL